MSENELRWQLRQLPREIEPPRDLWPGIADRLERRAPPRRRPWLIGLAMAASLGLAAGLAWQLRQAPATEAPEPALASAPAAPASDPQSELLRREAEALTREYEAALGQFAGAPVPAPLATDLATLDQSALDIRSALASDPEAVFLLDQLRRTYARRLSLTQRALAG